MRALNAPYWATRYSGLLKRYKATLAPGPNPAPINAAAKRAACSSNSRYVNRRSPCTTASASGHTSHTASHADAKCNLTVAPKPAQPRQSPYPCPSLSYSGARRHAHRTAHQEH